MDSNKFKQLVAEAKNKYKDDPEMMGVLNEMEVDVSLQSRLHGTLLTHALCQKKHDPKIYNCILDPEHEMKRFVLLSEYEELLKELEL